MLSPDDASRTIDASKADQGVTHKTPVHVPRQRKASASVDIFDAKEGLKVRAAADRIIADGPVRWGQDGQFWTYDDGVWKPGEDEIHYRIVSLLGDRYRSSSAKNIREVSRALVPRIDCKPVPQYINFRNGLLDWKTQTLIPHDPAVPTTVQLTIDWNPKAECPLFHSFLADVIADDDVARVWEVIGYMLMSGNPLHKAFLFAGAGRNGKSALMRTLLAILGEENVSHVPLADFSRNRFATAQLYGRMANVCGDIDSTYMEETGRFKEAVGEDELQAEHKFGQPFRFTAWCSMLFSANEIPGSADSSKGWVDRWEVIPFPKYIGDRVDKTLEPRLQTPESLQGIAAAAVAALRVLMDRGAFRDTTAGAAAKDEFKRKANILYQWIDDRAQLTPDGFERGTLLYEDYKFWCGEAGISRPLGRNSFYLKLRQLGDLGVAATKRNGDEGFKGLKLGKVS